MEPLRDPAVLTRLLAKNAREAVPADAEKWLGNPRNFAFASGDDLGMFEARGAWPGPLHAHVFFASRGKDALKTARLMLDRAFAYGATEILGETPVQFRDAIMFARLLGFRPYGEAMRPDGKVILSRLTLNNSQGSQKAA